MDQLPPPNGAWAPPGPAEEPHSKFDIWGLLNRRKWIIVLMTIVALGIGYFYHIKATQIYQSKSKVLIEPKDPTTILVSRDSEFLPDVNSYTTSHDKIIMSPMIIQRCLDNKDLYDRETLKGLSKLDAVALVLGKLNVYPDDDEANIFYLKYESPNSVDAGVILNAIVDTYEQELAERYQSESKQVIDMIASLEGKLTSEYRQLEQARLATLQLINDPTMIHDESVSQSQLKTAMNKIVQVREKLLELTAENELAEAALDAGEDAVQVAVWNLERANKIPSVNPTNSSRIDATRERISQTLEQINQELSELSIKYGENHPLIVSRQASHERWSKYLENLEDPSDEKNVVIVDPTKRLEMYKFGLDREIRLLSARGKELNADIQRFSVRVTEVNHIRDKLAMQDREIQNFNALLETVQTKAKEIDYGDESNNGFAFRILRTAQEGRQVWPNIFMILGIAGLAGSAVGFGIGYLVDIADKTFHSPDEIMKQLAMPLIGHIPILATSKKFQIENSYIDPVICTFHRPKSQSAEAFRAVRTALYFNTRGAQNSVIQVTSPTPGDGKSSVAANLAVSIAQSGKRVLLVDSDMRRPTIHHSFGIKTKEGFATVLQGEANWKEVVYECDEIEGLSIMPCGEKPMNPAELLTTPRFKSVVEEIRNEYDFAIFDTPPLLAVTDPCPVAARVDGVILTMRIKKNVRISSERAGEILNSVGANVIGVVVNGVGAQSGYGSQYSYGAYRSGYSYGYGYGHGYRYTGEYYEDDRPSRTNGRPRRIEASERENKQTAS